MSPAAAATGRSVDGTGSTTEHTALAGADIGLAELHGRAPQSACLHERPTTRYLPFVLPGSSQAEGAVMAIAALGGGAVIAVGATLASVWRAGRTRRRVQAMQGALTLLGAQLCP